MRDFIRYLKKFLDKKQRKGVYLSRVTNTL